MVGYGFLPLAGPDGQVIRLQADGGAVRNRNVVRCTPVGIPDPDMFPPVPVIVPVLLQEPVAGQHGFSHFKESVVPCEGINSPCSLMVFL